MNQRGKRDGGRIMAIVAALLLAAGAARGAGYFTWSTYGMVSQNPEAPDWGLDGVLSDYSVVWQLIGTPDVVANHPDAGNAAAGHASGGDVVWATREFQREAGPGWTDPGTEGTAWDSSLYADSLGSTLVSGYVFNACEPWYVYQRIFLVPPGGGVEDGIAYYDSTPVYVDATAQAAPGFTLMVGVDGLGFVADRLLGDLSKAPATGTPHEGAVEVLPEPGTLFLLAAGGATLALRSRRRRNPQATRVSRRRNWR